MNIEYISTLPVLRELYEKPRDMNRFNWYVEQMTGVNEAGKVDVVMPITAANPEQLVLALRWASTHVSRAASTLAPSVPPPPELARAYTPASARDAVW